MASRDDGHGQHADLGTPPAEGAKTIPPPSNTKQEPAPNYKLYLLIGAAVIVTLAVVLGVVFGTRNGSGSGNGGGGSGDSDMRVIFDDDPDAAMPTQVPVPGSTPRPDASLWPTAKPTTAAVPSARPTPKVSAVPTVSPTRSANCCFWSATNDPCNDCGSPASDEFCTASLDNCNTCGGTYCTFGGNGSSPLKTTPSAPPTLPLPTVPLPTPLPTGERPITRRNVFAEAEAFYVNPTYTANLERTIATTSDDTVAANLEWMKTVPSAYWIDIKSKITGNTTSDLRGILLDAAQQTPVPLCVFLLYNLPNRDCAALASRGQICCTYFEDGTCDYANSGDCAAGLEEYKTTYVDPYVEVLAEFDGVVPVAIIIEPDSLPNFATNLDNPSCGIEGTQLAYTEGIKYAVTQIAEHTDNVAIYLDAAHGGWLGWENNLNAFVASVSELGIESHIRGFATNVANYQGTGQPCADTIDCRTDSNARLYNPCCEDPCGLVSQYNKANNEHNYARLLVSAFREALPGFEPHIIIDTGRNGNPAARTDCATWCNPRDVLVGEWPTADTLDPDVVDAYFWLKTPGESDGCTETLPSEDDEFVAAGTCPRYDAGCAAVDSIGTRSDEPFAPEAGGWFEYQIRTLAATLPASARAPTRQPTTHMPTAPRPTGPPNSATTPVALSGALATSGNKVVGADGNAVQLVGMSLFWSNSQWEGAPFYSSGTVDTLVDDWKCTVVRAAMGVDESTGYLDDPEGNENRVRVVVERAIERGIYVIIDWHSHHAEDYLDEAKDFFQRMATDYGSYPNVIFEIYNEPIDTPWSTVTDPSSAVDKTIKGYSEEVIAVIRAISNNLIIVGTRFYSQFVWEAALDPISADNIAYTSHFYAGTHSVWERSLVRKGLLGPDYVAGPGEEGGWSSDQNPTAIPVFVTEWGEDALLCCAISHKGLCFPGTVNADGGGSVNEESTREWLAFCDTYDLSHANWALNDKDEGSAALLPGADPNGEWTDDDYSTSGAFIKSILLEYAGSPTTTTTPVALSGALATMGNSVVGADGNVIQLVGMSLFWSNSQWEGGERALSETLHYSPVNTAPFYTSGTVDTLIDDWKCTIVRAAMGVDESTGYLDDPEGNENRVRVVVERAIERGIYVIIDWHSHHAEDYLDEAKDFFQRMATDYGSYPNVIFEIYNEPIDTPWSTVTDPSSAVDKTIKGYSEEVIAVIRAISNNLIIVGTRFYSQFVWEAALDPISADNIAYTSHFYAGTHSVWERSLVRKGLLGPDYVAGPGEEGGWSSNQNPTAIPVFVTEWGTVNADGSGSVNEESTLEWLAFCETYHLSHANWALNDKDEGSAALLPGADPNGAWTDDDYSASGAFIRSLLLDYAAA